VNHSLPSKLRAILYLSNNLGIEGVWRFEECRESERFSRFLGDIKCFTMIIVLLLYVLQCHRSVEGSEPVLNCAVLWSVVH
jgi:hypothetical protein